MTSCWLCPTSRKPSQTSRSDHFRDRLLAKTIQFAVSERMKPGLSSSAGEATGSAQIVNDWVRRPRLFCRIRFVPLAIWCYKVRKRSILRPRHLPITLQTMAAPDQLRDQIEALLHRFAPSSMQDSRVVESLVGATQWFSVPGGNVLFNRGDPSGALYIVLSGVLGVMAQHSSGTESIICKLGPGEVVGEMGCITGEPRNATVRALRSTELLVISWPELERIAAINTEVLRSVCKIAIQRLIQTQQGRPRVFLPRTFSLISCSDGVDLRLLGEQLTATLRANGSAVLVTRDEFQNVTAGRLFQLEAEHDYLVYLCDRSSAPWTSFCLRQSDTVLAAGRGDAPARTLPELADTLRAGIPLALILCWPTSRYLGGTAAWLAQTGASRHFHVRGQSDLPRAVRLLTGRGFGLVLSGGGARGLAHVGVLRALREHGLEIDAVMGTSIGSLIGAAISLEWEVDGLIELAETFARANRWFEITIPRLSILAGRNINRSLRRCFADIQIEDTPIPFSCVSTDLTTGGISVHQTGSLQTWIRASTAVPGVFPPVILDGALHVDGGVLNNLPTDLIRANGAGFVVGVDVAANAMHALQNLPRSDLNPRNLIELLWRVCSIGDESQAIVRRKQCDVLIVPPVETVGLLNFRAYQWIMEQGYQATLKKLNAITDRIPDLQETDLQL